MDGHDRILLKKMFISKREVDSHLQFVRVFSELTINKAKIDETGIRFPEVTSKNSTEGSDTDSTFFELGKQKRKTDKGWRLRLFRFCVRKKS